MSEKGHVIKAILPDSIAEELELQPGDVLLDINGQEIVDILDYRFLCQDEFLTLHIRRGTEEGFFEVEKDPEDDLGLDFDNGLMDDYRTCRNRCIFCFIDQMPKGMRDTLYFKDDDSRLSFLQGNYVTLTNLSEQDMDRIIHYHLEPINVSVHTMDPDLRCRMLNNRHGGDSLKKLDRLKEAGIHMNGQIVLCPGINDGPELDRTIEKMSAYAPLMESVSVVPVGLTRYRDGLYPLKPVDRDTALEVIRTAEKWQKKLYGSLGIHFIHASDEFYLQTGLPIPEEDAYDGYLQLENGVGMTRLLWEEFTRALEEVPEEIPEELQKGCVSIATGELGMLCLSPVLNAFRRRFPDIQAELISVRNDFFGEQITVCGLITGQDLRRALKGTEPGSRVLISSNMLRSGERVFLDDVTVDELEADLGIHLIPVGETGEELLDALLGLEPENCSSYPGYEAGDDVIYEAGYGVECGADGNNVIFS